MGGSAAAHCSYRNVVSTFGIQVLFDIIEIFKIANRYGKEADFRWCIHNREGRFLKPKTLRGDGIAFLKQQVES